MKKYLIALLLSLSCACAIAATGCKDNSGNSSDNSVNSSVSDDPSTTCAISFADGEGFTYVHETELGNDVQKGKTVRFEIDLGGFYLDSVPVVYANDNVVLPDGNGVYCVTVNEDTAIRVEGVKKDVSNMLGTGEMTDAFLVTKPIDLVYIAEQVNKGVPQYVQGAYIVANDIDCKGEELKVIGDLSTNNSYFSGCFSCYTDPETNVMERYTISNFTINSQNTNYVGLFGAVQADGNVTSSALFYGIRLDNFTIEAGLNDMTGASKTLAVGSLVGYGAGANMYLCDATNGTINISGDDSYFSFAGGLIGYQQAYYSTMGQYFASEIAYAKVDVDVNILSGMTLYAGGIAGYLCTNYPLVSVATIHNSYALGDVAGALRTGGIAGGLGQYSTVNNCYAANDVSAIAYQNIKDGLLSADEYYYANAGGLIGFAENDSIVSDCFHNGSINAYATSGDKYAVTDNFVGGGYEAEYFSPVSEKYIALDCKSNLDLLTVDSTGGVLNTDLGWEQYDWKFIKGELPEINYETSEGTITRSMTLVYVTADGESVTVNKQPQLERNYLDTSSSANSYVTMGSFFAGGGLAYYYTADNGYCSFGYFFDKECTMPVPFAYMPTKPVTLYVGFYDLSTIAGSYYFVNANGETVEIKLGANGIATYNDGASQHSVNYSYNGKKIILESTRLTRYYDGEIIPEDGLYADENFDLYRYTYYNFAGSIENGVISIYDGYYFTADNPLVASNAAVPQPSEYDAFKGTWTKSANVRKAYTFDGKGNWSYSYDSKVTGTYKLQDDAITFTHDGVAYTASFNGDGLLQVVGGGKTQIFNRESGYLGAWTGNDYYYGDFVLQLDGIGLNGQGLATLTYENGLVYDLAYEETETENYVALYLYDEKAWKGDIFGYFYYNQASHLLYTVLYDAASETSYTQFILQATDDYAGEWICDADDLRKLEFDFNGIGLYASLGTKGTLTITDNGTETEVSYTLDRNLEGSFQYKGETYKISYDEDNKVVTVSYASKQATLERKDVFANKVFIDGAGNSYVFDGRSNLTDGGKLVVNETKTYTYFTDGEHYAIFDGASKIGSIRLDNNHYDLTISGETCDLYVDNELCGEWAMRGLFQTFHILHEDVNGNIHAIFQGKAVTMTYYDTSVLTFEYMEGKMPFTYYVFVAYDDKMQDDYLIITEYADLSGNDFIYCSRKSDLAATWTWNKDKAMSLTFDGTSLSYAAAYSGVAKQSRGAYDTLYYFTVKAGRIVLESQEYLQDRIWFYDVKILTETDAGYAEALQDTNSWIGDNGTVLIRTAVDSLYASVATDEDENEYFFDFVIKNGKTLGAILQNGELKYTYVMDEVVYNTNSTATIKATDTASGKLYTVTLDYSNSDGDVLIIGDEITE